MGDRFGPRVTLSRIVLWWSAFTTITGLIAGFRSLLTCDSCSVMGSRRVPEQFRGDRPLVSGRGTGARPWRGLDGGIAGAGLRLWWWSRSRRDTAGGRLFSALECWASFGAAWYWWFRDIPRKMPDQRRRTRRNRCGARHAPIPAALGGGAADAQFLDDRTFVFLLLLRKQFLSDLAAYLLAARPSYGRIRQWRSRPRSHSFWAPMRTFRRDG